MNTKSTFRKNANDFLTHTQEPAAITLVALIITVIILIILAGISLNLALGENGIFTKSKQAVDKYKDSAQMEQNEMDNLYNTLAKLGKKGDDTGGTLQPGDKSNKTEKDNYKDTNNDTATIPEGFTVSGKEGESTVDTGLVVIDENDNEWVWVPVSKTQLNEMYTESDTDIILYNQDNVKTRKYSKLYDFSSTERIGKEASSLLPSGTSYREPSLTTYDTTDEKANTYAVQAGFGTPQEMAQKFVDDYKAMIESIDKYGGFYIGRYELGKDSSSSEYVVQKYKTAAKNISWYQSYKACRDLKASSNNDVVTTMIWGTQWDRTLEWLNEAGDKKTWSDIASNSGSWGNYYDVTFEYKESEGGETKTKNKNESKLVPTGSSEHNKANNIYDLAGNLWEWTQEASNTYLRVHRGGDSYDGGSVYPAKYRYDFFSSNTYYYLGSRPTLYVVEPSSEE